MNYEWQMLVLTSESLKVETFTEELVQYGMRCRVIRTLPYAYSPCKDFIANYISRFIWKQQ